ncbi:MAG TPA: hypothetical protein VJY99_10120 [Buttiauxella sp.]|uniref:hypothetical protein n=1 Tax=Buttiauxella sp. TaxID=1972222 RepID=UPI002B473A2C|nr:hypothetical protein [Buttiauxella sp.]HKM97036.1 hypothetical protein [Buttiauxella sp.]
MYIEKFLTEYDDSLTGELNVDPLGQLVIWSSWGQDIFHSRITSIANDVRQYTLNLMHHSVLRQLLADDKQQTAGAMKGLYRTQKIEDQASQDFVNTVSDVMTQTLSDISLPAAVTAVVSSVINAVASIARSVWRFFF